jgi:tetratricopeptide (TPR) repeat protein
VSRRSSPGAVVLVIALVAIGGAPIEAQERAPEAAAAWLDQARMLFASGALSQADDFASRALEFFPDWSDARYLRARIALANRATTRQGIAELSAALQAASWTSVDPEEAAAALGDVLVRTRQYAEAIRTLSGVVSRRPELPAPLLALARAHERSGAPGQALAEAQLGWRLFPSESGFPVLASGILDAQGKRVQARALIREALALRPTDPALLLRDAELESDPARRIEAADRYLAGGGRDPLAAALGMEASRAASAPASKYLEQFIADGGLGREDLLERASLAVAEDAALVRTLGDSQRSFAGDRTLDADGDGWWEQLWRYRGGELTEWTLDENQDGVPELVETFASGAPASIEFRPQPDVTYTASYDRYPYVTQVAEEGPSGARTWLLAPATLSIPFLAEGRPLTPTPAEVRRMARRQEERNAGGGVVRTVWLNAGVPAYMEEDTTGDGRVDHKLWYVNGVPDHGLRDLTGNGTFPVRESWRDGKLASEVVDTNGDGRPDYEELYSPTPMRLWDYDEDGRWDSRQYSSGGGTTIREISTKLDSVFDVRVVFRAGRIAEITRSGKPLLAAADSSRGVTWIGAAARGAIPDPAGPDGLRFVGGKGYLLFRFEGTTYLEELP